ncbi:MAG: hypothetical protein OQK00_10485, partial [Rhodobacteraceae bacterium]|nr:hypothetical protein [Paracoccaceae bacterium]
PAVKEPEAASQNAAIDAHMRNNLRTETSYDRVFSTVEEALPTNTCLPDDLVDIAQWKGGGEEASARPLTWASLYDEAGAVDVQAVLAQARALLYQTFGREARQVLSLAPPSEEKRILGAMAAIMDSEAGPSTMIFPRSEDCTGLAVLWAFLEEAWSPDSDQEKAILRAFTALPGHLRRHLGPRIADSFLELGEVTTADVVSAMIDRVSEDTDPKIKLLQAQIGAEEASERARAESALADMVQQGERITPEALISLVDLYAERGFAPTLDTVALLEAIALEHRRSVLGQDLRRAHAIAAALAGHFEKAFDVARDVASRDGEPAAQVLRSRLVAMLLKEADDATILKIALGRNLGLEKALERGAVLDLSERLVAMDFPDQGADVLGTIPFHMTERERILRARLALSNGRPRQAEAELLGIESPDAQKLRARARALAGDHERAAAAYSEIGMQEAAAHQSWLAGDWTQALPQETPTAQQAPSQPNGDPNASIEGDVGGILARNRAEVRASVELRAQLNGLLVQYAPPDF